MTNNDSGLCDITNIDESIQGSSGIMPVMKKGNLRVIMHQVNGTGWAHIL